MELLSGNEAIAQGAWEAGARIGVAYPGTPSTETLEAFAKKDGVYAEWCVNGVAVEVGIGASAGGARSFDHEARRRERRGGSPVHCRLYRRWRRICRAGCRRPNMYSRKTAVLRYACAAMLDPADSAEALAFTRDAFELSERFDVPFFIRSSVRVSHTKTPVMVGFPKRGQALPNGTTLQSGS